LSVTVNKYDVEIPPATWKRIALASGGRELFEDTGLQSVQVDKEEA